MKDLKQAVKEFEAVNLKQNKRSLAREKDFYSYYRSRKLFAIDRARKAKSNGYPHFQQLWQNKAAEYDQLAKQSKARIRDLGRWVYKE